MKKIYLILILFTLIIACKPNNKNAISTGKDNDSDAASSVADSANYTTIQWLDSTYRDMGQLKKGDMMEITFRFRNTGNKPLVIADVVAGCGCTIPEKPTKPYDPGKEGVIKAKFDSKNQQPGEHTKSLTVTANTLKGTIHALTFRVEVIE